MRQGGKVVSFVLGSYLVYRERQILTKLINIIMTKQNKIKINKKSTNAFLQQPRALHCIFFQVCKNTKCVYTKGNTDITTGETISCLIFIGNSTDSWQNPQINLFKVSFQGKQEVSK